MNFEAAGQVVGELGAEIAVVKKTSAEYGSLEDPPPCPSVAVDGRFLVRNGTVTPEGLRSFILGRTQ